MATCPKHDIKRLIYYAQSCDKWLIHSWTLPRKKNVGGINNE